MDVELDLRKVFVILKRWFWLVLLSTVVFCAAAFCISRFLITPEYSATATLYVYNESSRSDVITSTDLSTSQKLVQTYIVVLTSNSVLEKVSEQLENAYSPEQIRRMISASAIDSTEAFKIIVKNEDPNAALTIANAIASVAPTEIIRVVKAGAVEVIDYATLPTVPSSPNITKNAALGALVGLVLSIIAVIAIAMFDTAVRTEDQLLSEFNIPVLGVIPTINGNDNAGGRYHEA